MIEPVENKTQIFMLEATADLFTIDSETNKYLKIIPP